MRSRRYGIRFPRADLTALDQSKTYFCVADTEGDEERIEFHDYTAIYSRPGLYEQLFYDRLKCQSPAKLSQLLRKVVIDAGVSLSQLRVLDVGAGNGMVGELLLDQGASRVVGIDILPAAETAAERDRPGVYDAYYTADLTRLDAALERDLADWNFDAMTCVAALGFGDIPVAAFRTAFNLIAEQGWIAFNIKESFLDGNETSGFSRLIRRMILDDTIDLYHLERYCHRLSIEGRPLHYFALVCRKNRNIDDGCADRLEKPSTC
ncbi:MAG: class I SAM-dependent methyltransferase [Rhodanobacteraceae bacterium]